MNRDSRMRTARITWRPSPLRHRAPAIAQGPRRAAGPRPKPLPLEAARKAEFTATKGTWISLDVSPDGQTIVFDLLGDLYTMPITGGKATRITSGMAYDAQPRFSPDGKRSCSSRTGAAATTSGPCAGRHGHNAGHPGQRQPVRLAGVDARRAVTSSRAARPAGSAAPPSSRCTTSDGGSGAADHPRRRQPFKTLGAAFGPDGRYIWYAGRAGRLAVQRALPAGRALPSTTGRNGSIGQMTSRYGSAFPAGDFARRQVAGLRHAAKAQDRAAHPRSRHRRGALAGLPGAARRTWNRARRSTSCRATASRRIRGPSWSPTAARSGGCRSTAAAATKIPFEARRQARHRPGGEVRVPGGHRGDAHGAADSRIRCRRPTARGWRSPRSTGSTSWRPADGNAARDHHRGRRRVPPGLVARRQVDRVGHLGRHGRRADHGRHRCDWTRGAGAAHPASRRSTTTWRGRRTASASWRPAARRASSRKRPARSAVPLGGEFVWVPADRRRRHRSSHRPGLATSALHASDHRPHLRLQSGEGLVSFRWDGTDVKQHLRVDGAPAAEVASACSIRTMYVYLPRTPGARPTDVARSGQRTRSRAPAPPAGLVMMAPRATWRWPRSAMTSTPSRFPEVGGPRRVISVANPEGATDAGARSSTTSAASSPAGATTAARSTGRSATRSSPTTSTAQGGRGQRSRLVETKVGRALRRPAAADSLKATRASVDSLNKAKRGGARFDQDEAERPHRRLRPAPRPTSCRRRRIRSWHGPRRSRLADSVKSHGLDTEEGRNAGSTSRPRAGQGAAPRDEPQGHVVLRGGRAITMKGKEIIENADRGDRTTGSSRSGARGRSGARRRQDHRRDRQDDHARIRRHPLSPPVAASRRSTRTRRGSTSPHWPTASPRRAIRRPPPPTS